VKVLLCSTYELGHQPLGIAGPASVLLSAGHDVEAADLSLGEWPADATARADVVVFSVPMHTATELAVHAAARIGQERPRPPFGFIGLYASTLEGHPILRPGDLLAAGETAPALSRWLDDLARGIELAHGLAPSGAGGGEPFAAPPVRASIDVGRASLASSPPPARHLLPALDRYARYLYRGTSQVAASVESSRGCNHRCRHCPVAAVYGGRSRAVALDTVLADIEQAVAMGASHISFADPDFLNRPAHAAAVAHGLHASFPELSFDATVKIEHVLRHRSLWPELRREGLSFIVSAFESTDDDVLALLDKGHSAADETEAVAILRSAGVEVRPSWLPFTPWTTLASLASLLTFTAVADLVGSTDAVQYSIRLLLPSGSLLLTRQDPVLEEAVSAAAASAEEKAAPGAAGSAVTFSASSAWRHGDPRIDALQRALSSVVEADADGVRSDDETFADIWALCRDAGAPLTADPPRPDPRLAASLPGPERPRLSEAWFCCAEPTMNQIDLVSS
jgi:hypothetical protein